MWTANAATVAPSSDTPNSRVHIVPANLASMFHRSLEAAVTTSVLRGIFADENRFVVHDPLPSGEHLADEGAANHIRLATTKGPLHVLGWGRSAFDTELNRARLPARQTREASSAVARLLGVTTRLVQQDPAGIDAGAFHTDVLACGAGNFLMLHERAFVDCEQVVSELREVLGPELVVCLARESEVPLDEAVRSYAFNSELVEKVDGRFVLLAPREAETSTARSFLDRVAADATPVESVSFVDVNSSMKNGGGPACLRLAIVLTESERAAIGARVILDDELDRELVAWVERHYRDRSTLDDLRDPKLLDEGRRALDELTSLLRLGPIYDFQR